MSYLFPHEHPIFGFLSPCWLYVNSFAFEVPIVYENKNKNKNIVLGPCKNSTWKLYSNIGRYHSKMSVSMGHTIHH